KKIRPLMVLLLSRALSNHVGGRDIAADHDDELPELLAAPLPSQRPDLVQAQRRLAEIAEVIHTASLWHDDVIDNAELRRGKAAGQVVFGNKMAILAGDFLLARACVALARLRDLDVVEILATVIEHLVLEASTQKNLLRAIGQLQCSLDRWKPCRENLESWIELSPGDATAQDYILVAQAYSATDTWPEVFDPATRAIEMHTAPPIDWHRLRIYALISLENWKQALAFQKTLIQQYPANKPEWRRLVSLQLQNEQYEEALGSLHLMHQKKWLDRESDYRQLIQLYQVGNLPYQAATIMQEGLAMDLLPTNSENLRYLASLWIAARETKEAIKTFQDLIKIDTNPEWQKQLANLYYQDKDWDIAIEMLEQILEQKPDPTFQLMLGISLAQLEQDDEARAVLEPLLAKKGVSESARGWLGYLNSL
ncbi:MAG: polyprenyl synthetase family protein, partial [Pseudomonadota bacterium]